MTGIETKLALDAAVKIAPKVQKTLEKFWSLLDAAEAKPRPSEALSPGAVRAIRGDAQ